MNNHTLSAFGAAKALEIRLQPPVLATADWSPPLQIGAPLGSNISRLEPPEREVLQWEPIYSHILQTQPEAVRPIEEALHAARGKRSGMMQRGDMHSAEAEFEQIKRNRIRARIQELWAATAVTRNSDEANNMLAAIRYYESGQIPYSDQWHLIYGGHLVDACPSYRSFTVDRHQRLDSYVAKHGEGWLWYEPPLSTAMGGEVWGASHSAGSSGAEAVVQAVAYAGTKLEVRDSHWGLGCHYVTMGFRRVKARVYRHRRNAAADHLETRSEVKKEAKKEDNNNNNHHAGSGDRSAYLQQQRQQRKRGSTEASSYSAKRIKMEDANDSSHASADTHTHTHTPSHHPRPHHHHRIRDRDPTAPLLGFNVLWDTGATFACLREADFQALGVDPATYAAQSYTSIRTVNGTISRPVYDMHSEIMRAGAHTDTDTDTDTDADTKTDPDMAATHTKTNAHAHRKPQAVPTSKPKRHRPLVDPSAPVWPGEEPMLGGIMSVVKLEQCKGDSAGGDSSRTRTPSAATARAC